MHDRPAQVHKYGSFGFPLSAVDPFVDNNYTVIFLGIPLWCGCNCIVVFISRISENQTFVSICPSAYVSVTSLFM